MTIKTALSTLSFFIRELSHIHISPPIFPPLPLLQLSWPKHTYTHTCAHNHKNDIHRHVCTVTPAHKHTVDYKGETKAFLYN